MCGHATLAGVHALIESGRFISLPDEKGTILPVQTKSGVLTVRCEQLNRADSEAFLIWLDLPTPRLTKKQCVPSLWAEILGVPQDSFDLDMPSMQSQEGDVLVFFKTLQAVLEARPNFAELARFSKQQRIRGFCLATTATLIPSITVQSRFFAPAVGIDEDPVTGSVHGPLAAYLVSAGVVPMMGDTAVLSCTQSDSTARAGLIRAVVIREEGVGFRVRIAGECTTVMHGKLHV
jgi:trans-2,3-dihydro-3-hydroxyanthranilate isomerase